MKFDQDVIGITLIVGGIIGFFAFLAYLNDINIRRACNSCWDNKNETGCKICEQELKNSR